MRMLTARNVWEGVLPVIPANMVLTGANCVYQIANRQRIVLNNDSNILIRKAGVFCNFADGLVFAEPGQSMQIVIESYALPTPTLLTGSVGFTYNSKLLQGVGSLFVAEIQAPGVDILKLQPPFFTQNFNHPRYVQVDTVTNDLQLNMTDYAVFTSGAGAYEAYAYPPGLVVSSTNFILENVHTLNHMYEVNHFISPALYASLGNELVIVANVNPLRDVTFFTKSIDTTFAGDKVNFDVILEIEITGV